MLISFASCDVILDKVLDLVVDNDVIILVNKHLLFVVFIYF